MLSTYFQRNMVIVVNFILPCNNLKSFRRQRKDRDKNNKKKDKKEIDRQQKRKLPYRILDIF